MSESYGGMEKWFYICSRKDNIRKKDCGSRIIGNRLNIKDYYRINYL